MTDDLMTLVRSLDPADGRVDPRGRRAAADLARILASDLSPAPAPHPRRRGTAVLVTAGLATAAGAGIVVLPAVVGGDTAFASWSAAPSPVVGQPRTEAADACRDQQAQGSPEYADALAASTAAVAEQRGVWTLVVLAGEGGFSALCITDDSARLFDSMFGSVGPLPGDKAPGPRELVPTSLGYGTAKAGDLSVIAGHAGADVTGVSYESRQHGRVEATVSGGHFALWFPGREAGDGQNAQVDVTYRDGSTATVTLSL